MTMAKAAPITSGRFGNVPSADGSNYMVIVLEPSNGISSKERNSEAAAPVQRLLGNRLLGPVGRSENLNIMPGGFLAQLLVNDPNGVERG
jgi:hypothetical protein